jgi:hypothetical protein
MWEPQLGDFGNAKGVGRDNSLCMGVESWGGCCAGKRCERGPRKVGGARGLKRHGWFDWCVGKGSLARVGGSTLLLWMGDLGKLASSFLHGEVPYVDWVNFMGRDTVATV